MTHERLNALRVLARASLMATAAVLGGVASAAAMSEEGAAPNADGILRSMSNYLAGLSSFSVKADIDNEIITQSGQKLQLSGSAGVVMDRAGKMYLTREGMFADVELFFDGKTLTIHGKKRDLYMQLDAPGSNDAAIRLLELETGLDMPGADLLFADPYATLASGVTQGEYIGATIVGGIEVHHLAFRKDKVDWQLWVKTGDQPLPVKYVITSKWMTGAPQYALRLHDWNTQPKIPDGQFVFTPPKGATRLDAVPVNELGEIEFTKEAEK